jgi:glycosyltransferase involved in cell wall biosynthesis
MTRISVVIPTYNRASLIQETLASILAQSRPADEIIVVDDGSKDDTLAVLAKYGERLIVKTIPNSGDLVARNVG